MSRELARIELSQDSVIQYMKLLHYGLRTLPELSDSKEIQLYKYDKQVPAEVAKHFSSQHIGMVSMPFDLEQELERSCRQAGLKGSKLRNLANELVDKYRMMSRTIAKGGINDKPSELIRLRQHMKHKSLLKNMVVYNLMKKGYRPSASKDVSQVARTATGFVDIRTQQHQDLVPEYKEQESLAYTAVRAPACYAAIYRVMKELKQRHPEFRPAKMLDFGCGPGTAIWAAQDVWGSYLQDVAAVDHADHMLTIGNNVQKRRADQGQWIPNIRWMMHLPGISKNSFYPTMKKKYNLVVAAYVLGEITNKFERDWLVRALWSQCNDVMIIMEPGTPTGSQLVREYRAMILREEEKRAKKITTNNVRKGVHIVAPCPHDGPCPMDLNKHWWCHFNQRFERTLVQRICKIRPGGGKPRDYQDERYSYVVLRRGERPQVEDVAIDAQFLMEEVKDVDYAMLPTKVVSKIERSNKQISISDIFPGVSEEEVMREDDELIAWNLLMQSKENQSGFLEANADEELDEFKPLRTVKTSSFGRDPTNMSVIDQQVISNLGLQNGVQGEYTRKLGMFQQFMKQQQQSGQQISQQNNRTQKSKFQQNFVDGQSMDDDFQASRQVNGTQHNFNNQFDQQQSQLDSQSLKKSTLQSKKNLQQLQSNLVLEQLFQSQLTEKQRNSANKNMGNQQGHVRNSTDEFVQTTQTLESQKVSNNENQTVNELIQTNQFESSQLDEGKLQNQQTSEYIVGKEAAGKLPCHGNQLEIGSVQQGDQAAPEDQQTSTNGKQFNAKQYSSEGASEKLPSANRHTGNEIAKQEEASKNLPSTNRQMGNEIAKQAQKKSDEIEENDDEEDDDDEDDMRERGWRFIDWEQEDPQSVEAAQQACSRWGRLLRPPFKQKAAVVIHVCASEGVLQKHVITKTDRKKYWFGKAGYRMARKARWGDLWPIYYNSNDRVTKLGQRYMRDIQEEEEQGEEEAEGEWEGEGDQNTLDGALFQEPAEERG